MEPTVSLIIVFRNEAAHLNNAIESLARQTYPKDLIELILVDGMSDDGSSQIAQQKKAELESRGFRVKLLNNPKKMLAPGWNIALANSQSDYVCRIDCHGVVENNYVEKGIARLIAGKPHKIVAVGGILKNSGLGFWGGVFKDFFSSKFGVGNSPFRTKTEGLWSSDTVAMGVYSKFIFDEVGYFDESLPRNQDIALHKKILEKGFYFQTDASMVFNYFVRSDFSSLLRKAWQDGYWIIPSGGGKLRHFIPSFFVSYIFALGFVSILLKGSWLCHLFALPLVIYGFLSLYFAQKSGSLWSKIFLPFIFLLYHFTYGLATIVGAFSKRMGA